MGPIPSPASAPAQQKDVAEISRLKMPAANQEHTPSLKEATPRELMRTLERFPEGQAADRAPITNAIMNFVLASNKQELPTIQQEQRAKGDELVRLRTDRDDNALSPNRDGSFRIEGTYPWTTKANVTLHVPFSVDVTFNEDDTLKAAKVSKSFPGTEKAQLEVMATAYLRLREESGRDPSVKVSPPAIGEQGTYVVRSSTQTNALEVLQFNPERGDWQPLHARLLASSLRGTQLSFELDTAGRKQTLNLSFDRSYTNDAVGPEKREPNSVTQPPSARLSGLR